MAVRKAEDEYLDDFLDLTDEQWTANNESDEWLDDKTYFWEMHDIRNGLQGVRNRNTNTWPEGYHEIRCECCTKWHPKFRINQLHPDLRFLGEVPICFRGKETQLIFAVRLLSDVRTTKTGFSQSQERVVKFAKGLKAALAEVENGSSTGELASQPAVTQLIVCRCIMIQNSGGLTVSVVVIFLEILRLHMLRRRKMLYDILANKKRWKQRNFAGDKFYEHGTIEAWENHIERYEEVVEIWEEAIRDVDATMFGVKSGNFSWHPMTSVMENGSICFDPVEDECRCRVDSATVG